MLRGQIRQIVKMNPGWASITPVIDNVTRLGIRGRFTDRRRFFVHQLGR